MRNISEWMEHVIARADRRAAHQVGGDRVSDALNQVEAVDEDGLWISSRAATILARRMGKAPFAGGHGGTINPQLKMPSRS
jgi:hypothetical protein